MMLIFLVKLFFFHLKLSMFMEFSPFPTVSVLPYTVNNPSWDLKHTLCTSRVLCSYFL